MLPMSSLGSFLLFLFVCVATSAKLVKRQDSEASIVYKQFLVDSLVVSRYAVTTITSVVRNDDPLHSRELQFLVQLPETAFISNFSMSVNGRTYYGVAKESEEARQEFENRISAGENTGLVQSRGSEVFSIRINTAASSEAEFVLQYEELLVRRRSTYTHKLNLNPGAVVEDLQVDVKVVDPQGVVRESAPDFATSNRISENELAFSYRPTPEQQREDSADFGLSRDLNIEFDVNPSPVDVGDFVVDSNCYFVQFFSRSDAVPVPVDLVFVIDVSGSMFGVKIQQTREALETIINQLRNTDRFTMLTFSDDVKYWKRELVLVSEHREEGVKFAQGLATESSTNFNDGLLQGADVLKASGRSDHVPLLVMLTDGVPTSGVTNENEIVKNARSALADTSISLNCLGFGQYLNFQLLEKLALQNRGTVRTIYEGSDAADQLEGFFDEISTPVLRNIRVSYDSGSIELVSNREFPLLFRGGEIVVAGQCNEGSEYINVEVTATGDDGGVSFTHEVSTSPTDTVGNYSPSPERLLAYLLIQQLLDSRLTLTDEAQIKAAVDEALELSLKYNFVTDLTSLIVVEEKADGGSGSSNDSVIGDRDDGFGLEEVDIAFSPGQPANSGDYGVAAAHSSTTSLFLPLFLALLVSLLFL